VTAADAAQGIGWVGAALLLLGYWLVSTRRADGEGLPFQVVNIAGSVFLGIAAVGGRVWSSAALNTVWAAIGVVVAVRVVVRRQRSRRTPGRVVDPTG
jgi:hypothetical protein